MTQVTKVSEEKPEVTSDDSEVVQFRAAFESRSVLDEIIRAGAQKMLQAAIEAEVDQFLAAHEDRAATTLVVVKSCVMDIYRREN